MQYATQHNEFPLKLGGEGKVKEFKGFQLPKNKTVEKYSCKVISPMIANQFIKYGRVTNNSKRNYYYFKLFKTSPNIFIYNLNDSYSIKRSLYEFTEYMITRYPDPSPYEKIEYVVLEKGIPSQINSIKKNINNVIKSIKGDFNETEISNFKNIMFQYKLNIIHDYLQKKDTLSTPKTKKTKISELSSREKNELRFLLTYHGEELSSEWQWAKNISMVYILDNPNEFSNISPIKKFLVLLSKLLFSRKKNTFYIENKDNKNAFLELKYSLRSIDKYLPWYQGQIYIILPKFISKNLLSEELFWLNHQCDRINLIYSDNIIPNSHKINKDNKTFSFSSLNDNSRYDKYLFFRKNHQPRRPIHSKRHQIEMFLDRITGITKYFIYMRPHHYFSNYTHPRFFFSSNSSLFSNDKVNQISTIEFYPKYQFKSFDSKPSEIIISSFSSKNNNSYNYTSSLLFQYFGTNYINIYRELKDAPIPLYRDLFPPTRELFQEEWTSLYTTNSYKQKLKTFMYDILPLYLVINFNIYGAAQPLYPEYIPGYGKIQDIRKLKEEKDVKKKNSLKDKIDIYDNNLIKIEEDNNHQHKKMKLLNSLSSKNTVSEKNDLTNTYYGYDIISDQVAKYIMITYEFKRHDPLYNHRLMQRLIPTTSNPSKHFFSLKWNNKNDLSSNNQQNFKKLMNYLYKEKSLFENEN